MGVPPPPDGPPITEDTPAPPEVPYPPTGACITTPPIPGLSDLLPPGVGAGFSPSIKGFGLCGFTIPPNFFFNIGFGVKIPSFDFPPLFFFALCMQCDLADPIDTEFGFGGGRVSNIDIDADDEAFANADAGVG